MASWWSWLGVGSADAGDGDADGELEVVDGDPWRGWRLVQVVVGTRADGTEVLHLAPLFAGGVFAVEDRAVCQVARHLAPDAGCVCGFNAFADPEDAVRYAEMHGRSQVATARVELAGLIVEHEHGARGEYQRVLEISWSPVCWGCAGPAGRLARYRGRDLGESGSQEVMHLGPSCGRCGTDAVTPVEATGQMAVRCHLSDGAHTVDVARCRARTRGRLLRRLSVLAALAGTSLAWLVFTLWAGDLHPGSQAGQVARAVVAGQDLDPASSIMVSSGPVAVVAHVDDRGRCWKLVVDRESYTVSSVGGGRDVSECAAAVLVDGPGGAWAALGRWAQPGRR